MAAEAREFAGLLPLCSGVREVDWAVHWARSGELRGRQLWMVANGAGPVHAGRAVQVGYAGCKPDVIVSMGFCGALDPELEIGDVFGATAVEAAGRRFLVSLPASDIPHATGVLASVDRVAQTVAEKRALRASGASAVEMEAAGVAQQANDYGVPLYCLRAVTDRADQGFVTDFNGALRSDGHFDTIRILSSAMRSPRKAFPELIRLRKHCNMATRTLGGFIAGCRF